jgi:hypothetical protein
MRGRLGKLEHAEGKTAQVCQQVSLFARFDKSILKDPGIEIKPAAARAQAQDIVTSNASNLRGRSEPPSAVLTVEA